MIQFMQQLDADLRDVGRAGRHAEGLADGSAGEDRAAHRTASRSRPTARSRSRRNRCRLLDPRRRERGAAPRDRREDRRVQSRARRSRCGRLAGRDRRRCDDRRAASRTCCASSRRRSSARSCGGTGSSTRARTPCRRRCSRRRCSGRRRRSRQPARLADHRRRPPAGRRVAQRERAPPARGDGRGPRASAGALRPRTQDDTLALLFLCCHPSLSAPSQLALTLRAVGGLTTAEIANAFLVPEATMAQRISRAKQTHQGRRHAASSCRRPPNGPSACASCCRCSTSSSTRATPRSARPTLQRADLTAEAIRLARLLQRLLPDEGEVAGLLALMLLTDARRAARTDAPTARSSRSPSRTRALGLRSRSPRASRC